MSVEIRTNQINSTSQKRRIFYWGIATSYRPDWRRWVTSLNAEPLDLHPSLPEYLPMLVFRTECHKIMTGQRINLQFIPMIMSDEYAYQIPYALTPLAEVISIRVKITSVKSQSPRFQRITVEYDPKSFGQSVRLHIPEELNNHAPKMAKQFRSALNSGRLELLYDCESKTSSLVHGVVISSSGVIGQNLTPFYYPPYYHERKFLSYTIDGQSRQIGFSALQFPSFDKIYRINQFYNQTDEQCPLLTYTFRRSSYSHSGKPFDDNLGIFHVTLKVSRVFFRSESKSESGSSVEALTPEETRAHGVCPQNYSSIAVCGELHARWWSPGESSHCIPNDNRESSENLFELYNLVIISHWRDSDNTEHAAICHIIGGKTPYIGSFPFLIE